MKSRVSVALHAGREAVGTCGRCGNHFCEVCRTRWRDQILCAACADHALESREATPEQERAHYRQALLGLLMAVGAWTVFFLGVFVLVLAALADGNPLLILIVLSLFISAMLLAVVGTGLATAALRCAAGT